MKLLTKDIERKLLKAHDLVEKTGETPDVSVVKFFDPCGRYTFHVFDGEQVEGDWILFGYVVSPLGPDCDEWGYTSLNEIASVKNRLGLGIERDMYYDGITKAEIAEDTRY